MDLVQFAIKALEYKGLGGKGRYAPSPTGSLHLGNLQTALLAWLHARLSGACFILRIEDLDRERSLPNGDIMLMEELDWLGIDWDDGPYYQSERLELYDAIFARLQKEGKLYPCFCSRREIRDAVGAPHGSPPVYPGFCRDLDASECNERKGKLGREPSWRFRSQPVVIEFEDGVAGWVREEQRVEVGDYPIRRSDGCYTYQFAVAVDDWLMGVTDVVRGEDLLSSAGRQIYLIRELIQLYPAGELSCVGGQTYAIARPPIIPRYWHTPLVSDQKGHRLSKRNGGGDVRKGRTPGSVVGEILRRLYNGNDFPLKCSEISALDLLDFLENHLSE